ncbi:MAG: hypothetical protein JWL59_1631 [Chthoniobacteraceae bacterium]|nr:hypothetical protein [Chthoniobacteraceae bacterium]
MLDLQIELQRNKRQLSKGKSQRRRLLLLFGSLLLLAMGLWMALLFLDSMAGDLPHRGQTPDSTLNKE